jgi:molybdenum cofactor cytidylyltransferase
MEALPSEAFYVGAMGSERTSEKRRARLLDLDLTTEDLSRLHGPVGLDLGSKTPPEIAIAILAELTQLRAAVRDGKTTTQVTGVGCIVLAAGSGSRFGSDKRIARYGASTLLEYTLRNIAPSFNKRILVLRPGDELLARRFAADWDVVFAPDADKGMGHSLAAAMERTGGWTGAVVALADMPSIRPSTYEIVRDMLTSADALIVPHYGDQRGNPVGIGQAYFAELARLEGDQGARTLLLEHAASVVKLDVDDPGILRDIDTPEALDRAGAGANEGEIRTG